jgi:hypothetical protein
MDRDLRTLPAYSHTGIIGVVTAWLIGSITFSLLDLFNQPDRPPTFFGLFLAGPILGFLIAYTSSGRVQEALLALPLWAITATHSLRLVCIAFVIATLTHVLPWQFGRPAGLGHAISAIISIPLAISLYQKRYSKSRRSRFIAWNILGLAGPFLSVTLGLSYSVNAVGILSSPISNTRALSFLPNSLMPSFYVPALILLHLLALRRSAEITESSWRIDLFHI